MRWIALAVGCLAWITLASAPMARAQSATISVAPIPATGAGSSITLSWTVRNTGSAARAFGVGAEIRHGEAILAAPGEQTTPTIAPGATASGSFIHALPT